LTCGLNIRGTGYDPMMILNHEGCFDSWKRVMAQEAKEEEIPDCMVRTVPPEGEEGRRVVESFALDLSRDADARWSTVRIQPISLQVTCESGACAEYAPEGEESNTKKRADFVTTRLTTSAGCVDAIRAPRGMPSGESRVTDEAARTAFAIARDATRLRDEVTRIVGGPSQPVFTISGDFNPKSKTHVNLSTTGMNVNAFSETDFAVSSSGSDSKPGKLQRLLQTIQSSRTFAFDDPKAGSGAPEPACQVYNTSMYMGVCRGGMRAELQKLSGSLAREGCPYGTATEDQLMVAFVQRTYGRDTTVGADEIARLRDTDEYRKFAATCANLHVIEEASSRYEAFAAAAPECRIETLQESTNECVRRLDPDTYTKEDYSCMVDFAVQSVTENVGCIDEYMDAFASGGDKDLDARKAHALEVERACEAQRRQEIIEDLSKSRGPRCKAVIEREIGKA
jgi:hypothetical protein